MIILEPKGGLANRMRVIASGLWLSNKTHKDVKLVWNLKDELNCDFYELFKPIDSLSYVEAKKKKYYYVEATNQQKLNKKIKAWFVNKLINIDYCIKEKDFENLIWNNKIDILSISKKHKNIYFQTCQEFGENFDEFLRFKPTLEIQDIINSQTKSFNKYIIGIHIRRSDNMRSIEKSPLELFIEKIKVELKKNIESNFFLATDDVNTEIELKKIFKGKIITYNKELSRNTQKGIKDAVVDLYCLSKTKYIYGSYWSSFSDIAARIGQIKVFTLEKK
ncbi:hypothetical protein SAMN06265371_111103 [Lutibacter agarilyticus]|uniref:Glycosyl transferase family 11 n=1 Tax=Lutibacter agarilyticus TaxID=1109740 RepID=A0A238YZD4_9FLAO|nr:hypothetical protein [Lutibacter agarilyticus]SNR76068.1 hypothetical protein SAMN06265371_111103 [Lutibacter agarilyticus]